MKFKSGDIVQLIWLKHPEAEDYCDLYIGQKGIIYIPGNSDYSVLFENKNMYFLIGSMDKDPWLKVRPYIPIEKILREVYK